MEKLVETGREAGDHRKKGTDPAAPPLCMVSRRTAGADRIFIKKKKDEKKKRKEGLMPRERRKERRVFIADHRRPAVIPSIVF